MLSAIRYLGPENVFVSIVESYSQDKTPELLRQFDASLAKLHVPRRIVVQDTATEKPEDLAFDNRIEFLAAVRNRAMEPLVDHGGYDKVLFSNDVFVEPESIIELIETANGDYDFACAMDFNHFGCVFMLWSALPGLTGLQSVRCLGTTRPAGTPHQHNVRLSARGEFAY